VVPFGREIGISPTAAAGALSLIAGMSITGRIGGGSLLDRMGWKKGLLFFLGLAAVMLLWLTGTRNLWMLYLFAIIYGFCYAAEIPAITGWTGALFGTKSLAGLLGIQGAISGFGCALGPILGGFIFDITESYYISFLIAAISFAAAAVLTLRLPHLGWR
jgi:MFS family permease